MDFSRDSLIKELEGTNPDYQTVIIKYADDLISRGLPVIFSLKHLSYIFGIEFFDLKMLLSNIDGYYDYYLIRKRRGGYRRVLAPYSNLRQIQKWILREILEKLPVHPQSKGFMKGCSTLQNAYPHLGKKYIRKFDFQDFFESISVYRVYDLFHSIGYSKAVSHDLASFCTLRISDEKYALMSQNHKTWFEDLHDKKKGVLPQGAPTSPALANLICYQIDDELWSYAISKGIQYTRYADDLTFSSDQLDKLPSEFFIKQIIRKEGLKLNYLKTGTFGRNCRQMVTGVLINADKPRVPQKFKREIYRHLYFCQKFGVKSHFDHVQPGYKHARQWIYGKIFYVRSIEPEEGNKMLTLANSLNWEEF